MFPPGCTPGRAQRATGLAGQIETYLPVVAALSTLDQRCPTTVKATTGLLIVAKLSARMPAVLAQRPMRAQETHLQEKRMLCCSCLPLNRAGCLRSGVLVVFAPHGAAHPVDLVFDAPVLETNRGHVSGAACAVVRLVMPCTTSLDNQCPWES